jgi:hypothetical protein
LKVNSVSVVVKVVLVSTSAIKIKSEVAVGPIGPVGPVLPVNPVGPVCPVEPVGPVLPVNPVEPVNPVGPVGLRGITPVVVVLIYEIKLLSISKNNEVLVAVGELTPAPEMLLRFKMPEGAIFKFPKTSILSSLTVVDILYKTNKMFLKLQIVVTISPCIF